MADDSVHKLVGLLDGQAQLLKTLFEKFEEKAQEFGGLSMVITEIMTKLEEEGVSGIDETGCPLVICYLSLEEVTELTVFLLYVGSQIAFDDLKTPDENTTFFVFSDYKKDDKNPRRLKGFSYCVGIHHLTKEEKTQPIQENMKRVDEPAAIINMRKIETTRTLH